VSVPVFSVLGSTFSVRVLVLCSVLGSGFWVQGSIFAEPNAELLNPEPNPEPKLANGDPNPELVNPEPNPEPNPELLNPEPNPELLNPEPNPEPNPELLNPEPEHEQRTENPEQRTAGSSEFWCPMHPNVRSVTEGKCPECGMALVPIPDNTNASYWLDVASQPAAVRPARPVRLRIIVRDRANNAAVTRFDQMHERLLHLFIVSGDLTFFDHVHPEPAKDGAFEIAVTFPKAGAYRLVADVLPTGAMPQTLQHTIVTTGAGSPLGARPPAFTAEVLEAQEGGVRARLLPDKARVGDDAHVVLELSDIRTSEPVTDVEPYLGAWAHMLLSSSDLADIVHSHPLIEETVPGGPKITFQTLFARPGWYRVWAQVQRRGRLLTFGFTVRVAPAV
jgi:hypothetical protein